MAATKHEFYDQGEVSDTGMGDYKWKAQSFTIGTVGANENQTISSVVLKWYPKSTINTITVSLKAVDGNDKPTGAALASGTISGDTGESTPGTWETITMSSYEMVASTSYTLEVKAPDASATNSMQLRLDTSSSAPNYAGGSNAASDTSGSTWIVDTDMDYQFEVWAEAVAAGTQFQINRGDAWKVVDAIKINRGDAWKEVVSASVNQGDAWKTIF